MTALKLKSVGAHFPAPVPERMEIQFEPRMQIGEAQAPLHVELSTEDAYRLLEQLQRYLPVRPQRESTQQPEPETRARRPDVGPR